MKLRFSRRALLKSLGLGMGMLPIVSSEYGYGQSAEAKRKLLVLVKGEGTSQGDFWPQGTGSDLMTHTLPAVTAPLEPFKKDLIFMGGLAIGQSLVPDAFVPQGATHHNFGMLLTGTNPVDEDGHASSQSVDNRIAAHLASQPDAPAVRNLVLGVRNDGSGSGKDTASWNGSEAPNPANSDPYAVFADVFAGRQSDDSNLQRLRARKESILDYVGHELEGFATNMGGEDRRRVEQHLNTVREIEKQLSGVVSGSCPALMVGDKLDIFASNNFPTMTALQMKLAVAALACGVTRVASITLSDSYGQDLIFTWLGDEFNEMTSEAADAGSPGRRHYHDITHAEFYNDAARARKQKVERWFMEQFALLLGLMADTRDGGGTLLDSTGVLWVDSANIGGYHSCGSLPWILAGRCGGYFKTGQVLRFGNFQEWGNQGPDQQTPHNRVLLSLCEAMGVPSEGFGDDFSAAGPLTELTG
jgi:hypothetical protein